MPIIDLALAAISSVLLYGFYKVVCQILHPYFSSLRDIPGPKSSSFIYGHIKELRGLEESSILDKWIKQYGKVMKINLLLGVRTPYTGLDDAEDGPDFRERP